MKHIRTKTLGILIASACIFCISGGLALAAPVEGQWQEREVDIRGPAGMRIVSVSEPVSTTDQDGQTFTMDSTPAYPVPPLAGFSPLVAITTSDKRRTDDLNFEHELETGYAGTPLNGPASQNYVIGVFDSGSAIDLIAEPHNATLGVTGSYLTENVLPIGGVGGTTDAVVTQPLGLFAAGLSSIDSRTSELDLTQVVGHSNDSILVAPEISCSNGESITGVIGTALISFYNTIIEVDQPVKVTVDGQSYQSPSVTIQDQLSPLPSYSRLIAMEYGGPTIATTSAYYAFVDGLETLPPFIPTMLVMLPGTIPLGGGNFYVHVGAIEGEPGPTNPLQDMRMLLDTGAQASIMTLTMAANLSLDLNNPDFTVDVCGVGGLQQDVPGFYIDYIKMNAAGGALEFAQAPFVVIDMTSPDGGEFAGVLGMNFFWNRNVIFQPSLSAGSFFHVSDPIAFAYGDFDRDFDVDGADYATFSGCTTGAGVPITAPECKHIDADGDDDIDQTDFGYFQTCFSGEDVTADVNCGL